MPRGLRGMRGIYSFRAAPTALCCRLCRPVAPDYARGDWPRTSPGVIAVWLLQSRVVEDCGGVIGPGLRPG